MEGLTPSLGTGGLPRPHGGSVGSSLGSALKTKMSSFKGAKAGALTKLSGVKMPKTGMKGSYPKLSAKTKAGTAVKAAKPMSTSGLKGSLKSLISAAKKAPASPAGPMGGMGMPSSAIGAPATPPNPAFFGAVNPRPSPGVPGIGLGM